jgi:hypothetical protein
VSSKLLLALVAPAMLSSAPLPPDDPYDAIKLVRCGRSFGTAFQVSADRMITAQHVTVNGPCSIDGAPVRTVKEDARLDVALIERRGSAVLRVSCGRPRKGHKYRGIGYAGGVYRMDSNLVGTGRYFLNPFQPSMWGMSGFRGNAIPGMSGGPILNKAGDVVALINAGNASVNSTIGRAMADTELCGKR